MISKSLMLKTWSSPFVAYASDLEEKITNLHKQQDKTILSQGFQVAGWLK